MTVGKNPAPFSDSVIEALRVLIPKYVSQSYEIHDPFAGEGMKLGALCDRLGYRFTGIDLECWDESDPRVHLGDSTSPGTYPIVPYAVVCSPTYNNGVNDHWNPKDKSTRLTYRTRAGHDLHLNNTARWSGRRSKRGEENYWAITYAVVANWPNLVMVNLKNSIRAKEIYPLIDKWVDLLQSYKYEIVDVVFPACPGWRFGQNGSARMDAEIIIVAQR